MKKVKVVREWEDKSLVRKISRELIEVNWWEG